jgi:hypothetical protein
MTYRHAASNAFNPSGGCCATATSVSSQTGRRSQKSPREDGLVSHLALLVYLDRVEEGGATSFPEAGLRAVPRPGSAVLFQNATLHAGEEVVRGQKHVLRADVMYRDGGRSP